MKKVFVLQRFSLTLSIVQHFSIIVCIWCHLSKCSNPDESATEIDSQPIDAKSIEQPHANSHLNDNFIITDVHLNKFNSFRKLHFQMGKIDLSNHSFTYDEILNSESVPLTTPLQAKRFFTAYLSYFFRLIRLVSIYQINGDQTIRSLVFPFDDLETQPILFKYINQNYQFMMGKHRFNICLLFFFCGDNISTFFCSPALFPFLSFHIQM